MLAFLLERADLVEAATLRSTCRRPGPQQHRGTFVIDSFGGDLSACLPASGAHGALAAWSVPGSPP